MRIVIIGNGISGITCARFLRKLGNHEIVVISSESKFFFSRTALMYLYMGHMRQQDIQPYSKEFWEKNNISLLQDHVENIDFYGKQLQFSSRQYLKYDKLVLALGSKPNKFGWPGQDLEGVSGLYSLQDLEAIEKYSEGLERAVIVGGGLIGVELAEMFHSRKIAVSMLVREENYWDIVLPEKEAKMISRHILSHGIDLSLSTELEEILDDGTGKACGVRTNRGDKIDCGFVGLTAGVRPNVDFLKSTDLHIENGIVVDDVLKTNIDDVYAIGDCAQLSNPPPGRRSIEAVWYTGRMMGETAAYNICGHNIAYDPGIWYNSAKFFDIEYQVYGDVSPVPNDMILSFYWEAENENRSLRINFSKSEENVIGFNAMGFRLRQEVCEAWIRKEAKISEVVQNLSLANFDPEFCKSYEDAILQFFNRQFQRNLSKKVGRNYNEVFNFLRSHSGSA